MCEDDKARPSDEDLGINAYDQPYCEFCEGGFFPDQNDMYVYRMQNTNPAYFVCAACLLMPHVRDALTRNKSTIYKVELA